ATFSHRTLSSREPGTTAGPLSPPRTSDRALDRLSFPLGLSGAWHLMQRAFRSGCTSASREGRLESAASQKGLTSSTATQPNTQPNLPAGAGTIVLRPRRIHEAGCGG